MSQKRRSTLSAKRHIHASVFAALGDETRLALVAKLAAGQAHSISQLAKGSQLTRQAIRKHLGVLEAVGMVQSVKTGRENRFAFMPRPTEEIRQYLEFVSQQWDQALSRLKSLVESEKLSPGPGSSTRARFDRASASRTSWLHQPVSRRRGPIGRPGPLIERR